MNKKILLISPFFAPESHAAMFRVHKIAKYLSRMDWEVHVLTVDVNYEYNEDLSLLDDLKNIKIHRASFIDPTIRGLRKYFFGEDLTYKTIKNTTTIENGGQLIDLNESLIKKLYLYGKKRIDNPDRFWTWKRPAIRMASAIITKYCIENIYTTCLPFTCNEIGLYLKKKFNVKWIADFRDPITYSSRMHSDLEFIFRNQRKIQDNTFKFADAITTTSSSYKLIFSDQYNGLFNNKIYFIPTGIDDDLIIREEKGDVNNRIIYVGEFLKDYGEDFMMNYSKVIISLGKEVCPRILIVGNIHINKRILLPILNKLAITDMVDFMDYLPQRKLYYEIVNSKYCLLIPGKNSHWWCNFAKLVDYIGLKVKVIADVPRISEARVELEKSGLGLFLESNNLLDILEDKIRNEVDHVYCKRYLASSQVKSLVDVLNVISL